MREFTKDDVKRALDCQELVVSRALVEADSEKAVELAADIYAYLKSCPSKGAFSNADAITTLSFLMTNLVMNVLKSLETQMQSNPQSEGETKCQVN